MTTSIDNKRNNIQQSYRNLALFLFLCGAVCLLLFFSSRQSASAAKLNQDGIVLFSAKGCSSCHKHSSVVDSGRVEIGPDLSNWRGDPAFLRRWLANPAAIRSDAMMPNLRLSHDEIEALVAFLTDAK